MFQNIKNTDTYIIAEIGGNFTNYEEAVRLIDAAKYSGVDCVKLQTFRAETITSKKAVFEMENLNNVSQYEFFKKYEIDKQLHKKIFNYAESLGMDYFSTPSHIEDVDMLIELGVSAIKIGADDATNIPMLRYIAKKGYPIILSTGMCTMEEVRQAVYAILEEGNDKIAILHTISAYPTYSEQVNLNVINSFKKEFPDFSIGFSDHTMSTLASITAAAMGADIIERHFTLNKDAEGADHLLSSTPEEMKYIVDSIRTIHKMKGSYIKRPVGPEIKNRINNRKSIVVVKDINIGEKITKEHIDIKRPGHGIEPKYFNQVLGRTVNKDLDKDSILTWEDL